MIFLANVSPPGKPGAGMSEAAICGRWFFQGAAEAACQLFLRD